MVKNKAVEKKSYARKKGIDYTLLFVIIFLLCFGLVMLYSTSSYSAVMKFGDGAHYLKNQLFATVLGIAVMAIVARVDYRLYAKLAYAAYGISLLTVVAIIWFGIEANGAKRWLSIGIASFQPAEFVKLGLIMACAYFICTNKAKLHEIKTIAILFLMAAVAAVMLIVITNNLSSAIITFGIAYVMVFIASPRTKLFVGMFAAMAVAGGAMLMFGSGFRNERIMAWLEPEAYANTVAYQTMQARYAIGSGGLIGKGLGQSVQKLGYVPEAQNDMIFSIICEELGLFGGIAIMVLFGFMIYRLAVIAMNARDLYGSMIAVGVLAHIAIQVVLNVAVVTGVAPNTGVTLPFISYGGTSILFLMAEMGLALSVSKYERGNR